jgi:hypothetical protein
MATLRDLRDRALIATMDFGLILYLTLLLCSGWHPVVPPIFGFFVFGLFSGYAVYLPALFDRSGSAPAALASSPASARSSPASWSARLAAASTG